MGLQEGAEDSPSPTWPDGNSSLLRLLVDRLIPGAVSHPGGAAPTMENVVNAVTDYSKLDRRGNKVRIRLHSLVFRVEPAVDSRKKLAEVDYLIDGEKSGRRVRAKHVVMACWNRVTAHVLEDLPRQQVKDLCYARKTPLIYGRAALNNWQAFKDAKIGASPRAATACSGTRRACRRGMRSARSTARRRTHPTSRRCSTSPSSPPTTTRRRSSPPTRAGARSCCR